MNINVRNFIFNNITPYDWNGDFLSQASNKTKKLRKKCTKLLKEEREKWGVLDIDTKTISTIISHKPGYIDKKLETIVWFQTDQALKRSIKPFWWRRIVKKACEENNRELDPKVIEILSNFLIAVLKNGLLGIPLVNPNNCPSAVVIFIAFLSLSSVGYHQPSSPWLLISYL